MTDKVRKLSPAESQAYALAPVMQRWAELCKQHARQEPSAALRWYLSGRADAHEMDAARLREALTPSILQSPPDEGAILTRAYEALLQIMRAITQPDPPAPPQNP